MKKTAAVILLSSAILLPAVSEADAAMYNTKQRNDSYSAGNYFSYQGNYYGGYYGNYYGSHSQQQTKPQQTPNQPAEKPQTPEKPGSTQQAGVSAEEQAVLDLTNKERAKAGLKPLQIDAQLQKSAKQKSADMAKNRYFSHTSPTYGSPFYQMKMNGVTYKSAAENIAMGQRSAQEVVTAWMNSAGHKENILTPSFTHIGIGHVKNGNYWTQQFIQK